MKHKKWILITFLCTIMGMLSTPQGLYAIDDGNLDSRTEVKATDTRGFSTLAVDTVRPTSFTFDSPLLRITGMYGVGHQAFLENIEHLELVAVTSNEMDIPYVRASNADMKRLSSSWLTTTSKTARQFREAQQKYITADRDDQDNLDGPVIGVASDGRSGIADQLPDVMSDQQFVSFHGLSVGADGRSKGHCGCNHECDECDHDNHACGCHEEDSCSIDEETCEQDSCCDCCCDCCCEEEEAVGLVAASGYSGYGGGGGGVGTGSDTGASAQADAEADAEIIVPEPSTYLMMAGMALIVLLVSHRKKLQQQKQTTLR